ncbi:MAG: FliM/FliN family flagellar motor switch protein [Planctomycetes bacterium]|nr:FliM/FliN family flagellar motor switch protein [Planctomycetota bacterium]
MPDTIDAPIQNEAQGRSEPPVPAQARPQVREVQFAEAPPDAPGAAAGQFDILLDMSVPVTVVLGEIQIPIRRLLQLGPGSVLKLEKPIEAPAELHLKNSKFAEVEVVVVEDRFAVRIKQILGAGTQPNATGA